MEIRTVFESHLHPRDLVRNMGMFEVVRSFVLIVISHSWPAYSLLVLDLLVALIAGGFDHPKTRSWPRMMLAGVLVEILRYGYAHAPRTVR